MVQCSITTRIPTWTIYGRDDTGMQSIRFSVHIYLDTEATDYANASEETHKTRLVVPALWKNDNKYTKTNGKVRIAVWYSDEIIIFSAVMYCR